MTGANKRIAAGANSSFIGFYDDNFFPTGGTPTAPTNGDQDGNPSYHIVGMKTASPTVGEPEVEVITGDDVRLGEFTFESIASRRFTIDVAVGDLTLNANVQGTNVETIADMQVGALDIVDRLERDGYMILQGRAKKQDSGVKGKKGYDGVFIPLANFVPLGRVAFNERTGAVYRYSVTPQVAQYNIWGITIAEANAGTIGLNYRDFSSEYPVHVQVFSGDGIETDWIVKHRPVSAVKVAAWADRVSVPVSSIVTGTRTITLGSAVRAGGRIVIAYQYDVFNE